MKALLDWLDSRTSYRRLLHHLLYEELPSGTAWLFTTGSVVTLLIACQFVTGLELALDDPDPRMLEHTLGERARDAVARGGAACVDDTPMTVAALEP